MGFPGKRTGRSPSSVVQLAMDRPLTERERLYASGSRKRDNTPTGNPRGRPKGSSYKPQERAMAVFAPSHKTENFNDMLDQAQVAAGWVQQISDWCYAHAHDADLAGHARSLERLATAAGDFANAVSRVKPF